jgi:uncharacterized protein (TIGR02391 family)
MTDKTMPTTIANLKDIEIILALKRMCRYLVDDAWNTSADAEYEFAISKTKEHAQDIKMLAEIDGDVAYGQMKHKNKDGLWVSKDAGDLSPWYEGELTLEDFLDSVEHLVELIDSTTPKYMPEVEFVHYYNYLMYVRPKFPSIILNKDESQISFESLHPKIQEHCEDRFYNKQYSDAILAAYKVVLNEIKDVANIHDLDGKQLVEKAFSLNNPIIKLNDLVTQSDKDEQQGFMMLFSGAAVGIRNPKAHDLVIQTDKLKTLRYLTFASLLLERLDERTSP